MLEEVINPFLTSFYWFFTRDEVYTIEQEDGREVTVVDVNIGGSSRRFVPESKRGAKAFFYTHPEAEGLRASKKIYHIGKLSVGTYTPIIDEETGEESVKPAGFIETPDIERLNDKYPEEILDTGIKGSIVKTPLKFQAKVMIDRDMVTTDQKVFKSVTAGMMSPDEIREMSVLEVTNYNIMTTTKQPTPVQNGPVDGRLGASDYSNTCLTCDLTKDDEPNMNCMGHFGHLELPIPIPHPLFAISSSPNLLESTFNMFCHHCGKIPIADEVREVLLPQVDRTLKTSRNDSGMRRIRNRTMKAIEKALGPSGRKSLQATGYMDCPHCEQKSPRLTWDKRKMMFMLTPAKKGQSSQTYYDYQTAHLILQDVSHTEARLMGFDAPLMRPEYMFLEVMPIAPNTMRPMQRDFATGKPLDNDLTVMYSRLIWRAQEYARDMTRDVDMGYLTTTKAKELFISLAHCFYNQDPNIGSFGSKSVRTKGGSERKTVKSGVLDGLIGVGRKKSAFRRRINSKTVDNVVRSVITPSGGLSINEVGVPKVSCLNTFVRVKVTEENIEQLRELVIKGIPRGSEGKPLAKNGKEVDERYPGAHWVERWGLPTKKPFELTDVVLWSDSKSSSNNTWTIYGKEWLEHLETLERPMVNSKDGKGKERMSDQDWNNMVRAEKKRWTYEYSKKKREDMFGEGGTSPLRVGDIVARSLLAGDYVLFGRQPSLHRQSLNGLRVVPMNQHSLSFNPAICVPMNADYDGDQCNMYVPGSEEAMHEIRDKLQMRDNMLHHRMGKLVIGTDHDQTSGVYLLTMKNKEKKGTFDKSCGVGYDDEGVVYFTKKKMSEIFQEVYFKTEEGIEYIEDLGTPDRKSPTSEPCYSGYHCISLLIPEGINAQFKSGLVYDENGVAKEDDNGKTFKDNTVIIDGQVITGTLDKTFMGKEKGTLAPAFYYRFGYEEGNKQMHRFVDMLCRLGFAAHHAVGYSMGVADCGIPSEHYPTIREGYDTTSEVCTVINKEFKNHNLQRFVEEDKWLSQGEFYRTKNEKQQLLDASPYTFREQLIYEAQSPWEDNIVREVSAIAGSHNAMEIAVRSGGRGKELNIQQMSSAYGQVRISGKLPIRGYQGRMFAHYPLPGHDIHHPVHNGYVKNCYYTGLEPHEYFTVCIAGRRSDMESSSGALQDSGYLANKLRRGMESLVVDSHRRVIDLRTNQIVSFTAGDDGFRPYSAKMVNRFPDGNVTDTAGTVSGEDEDFTIELQPFFFDFTCKHDTPLALECAECSGGSKYVDYFGQELMKKTDNVRLTSAVTQKLAVREVMKRTVDAMLDKITWWVEQNMIQPGEAIGSTAAGCLAEPATQASLRTFHAGGKGQGTSVKRLEAIVEGTDATSTASSYDVFTSVKLKPEYSDLENAQKIAKWCTVVLLGEVIETVDYEPEEGLVVFNINKPKAAEVEVDFAFMNRQINRALAKPTTPNGELVSPLLEDGDHFVIKCDSNSGRSMLNMKEFMTLLHISGLPSGGVTYLEPAPEGGWSLLIAGSASTKLWDGITAFLSDFVELDTLWCDNPKTIEARLGLEAALACAEYQLNYQMNSGSGIGEYDYRYVRTVIDSMGVSGKIVGHGPSGQSVTSASNLMDAMSMEDLKKSLLAGIVTRNTSNLRSVTGSTVAGRPPLVGQTYEAYNQ